MAILTTPLQKLNKLQIAGAVLLVALFACSEFNQPVTTNVELQRYGYDMKYYSGSKVSFNNNGKTIELLANWNVESEQFPMEVKVFIKKRNENEYRSNPLSGTSVDRVVNVNLDQSSSRFDIVAFYNIVNGGGDTLYKRITWSSQDDRSVGVTFEDTLRTDFQFFFWQAEFYVYDDTIRIPEQPGIWYFTYSEW